MASIELQHQSQCVVDVFQLMTAGVTNQNSQTFGRYCHGLLEQDLGFLPLDGDRGAKYSRGR